MSKGLEALKDIENELQFHYQDIDVYNITKFPREINTIEKELKALEIIKNKQVQMAILSLSSSCVGYNMTRGLLGEYLTEEEYDFLKEVLK